MKITQQLKSAAIGILVIGSSSLVSVYLNSLGNDSKVVNSAGIVRGGTQRLVKLELAGQHNDRAIEKQDKLVRSLLDGDRALGLPAATDPEFRDRMQKVANAWQDLKQKIVAARQDSKAKIDLLAASEQYFELADKAVSAAEKYSSDKTARLRIIQVAIFAASLLLLIIIWMTVNKIAALLANSTTDITNFADRIAKIVGTQEKSINHQALAVSKTTQLMSGLQDMTHQSTATAEMSVDRVKQTLDLLKTANANSRKNSLEMSNLQEKINAISTHIDLLNRQIITLAKITVQPELADIATAPNRLSSIAIVNRQQTDRTEINKLFNQLQSSIAAMNVVAIDSSKIIDIEAKLAEKNTSDLYTAITLIDDVSLNNHQIFTTAKQYTNSLQQVMTLMERLNVGAQDTASSISQIRASAGDLTETTTALKTKI